MRFRCSGAMPLPESVIRASTCPFQCGDAQITTTGHGILGIEQQVEEDLLQFAWVTVDGRQLLGQVEIQADLCGLELVFEQCERVANNLVEVGLTKLGSRRAGEVEQCERVANNLVEVG